MRPCIESLLPASLSLFGSCCMPCSCARMPVWKGTALWPLMPAARAAGLSFAGLIFGALVGGAFQGWLRVDIVPIGVSQVLTDCIC